MRDYDRLQALTRTFLRERKSFDWWYSLLKQCWPVPDYALAFWLGVFQSHFSLWKCGKKKPSKSAIQTMAMLCFMRIGGPESITDLNELSTAIATGRFKERVLDYLEWEKAELARRAARKEAKSRTRVDTPPPEVDYPMI